MAYLIGSADTARFSSTYAINSGASGTGLHLVGNPTETTALATGVAGTLSIYVSSWGAQTNIKCAIYDESSAGALLDSVVIPSSEGTGLITVALSGGASVTSGNHYRLGIYTEDADDITMFSDVGGLTLRRFSTSGSYAAPSDPSNQSGGYDSSNEFYFAVEDSASPTPTIDNIDTDNSVQAGQTGVIITVTA